MDGNPDPRSTIAGLALDQVSLFNRGMAYQNCYRRRIQALGFVEHTIAKETRAFALASVKHGHSQGVVRFGSHSIRHGPCSGPEE